MMMLRGVSQLLTKKSPYGNFKFTGISALTTTSNYFPRSSIPSVQHQSFAKALPCGIGGMRSSSSHVTSSAPPMVELDYENLMQMTPVTLNRLRQAFMGNKAYGAIVITGIPEYGEKRRRAFRAGIDLALKDAEGRKKAAAVNNTYPGWSGTPGSETHPLQSSFLFNVKEEVGNGPDPYFGKNIFPSKEFQDSFVDLAKPMHEAALQVLRGCDLLVEVAMGMEGHSWSSDGRSLHRLGLDGPALAGRFICYDSAFTREDTLLDEKEKDDFESSLVASVNTTTTPSTSDVAKVWQANGNSDMVLSPKPAGHAGDGLASMRTHSTPIKSAGHAGDGLASMRTHSTPVKSAGHAGDGLASMRTHSTPVKSAGHAGDGLASMRTHSTPVKSAGHAGDGLASMRTHSTPVKSAGHAGDGLASIRTHPIPAKSSVHAGDGFTSIRAHSTSLKPAGYGGDGPVPVRTHTTSVQVNSSSAESSYDFAAHNLGIVEDPALDLEQIQSMNDSKSEGKNDVGDYWLPWHIDSNFVTLIHKEMYAYESDASFAPEPEGAGVVFMNKEGDVQTLQIEDDGVMILQMGAFAQIYAGGHLAACRHAVVSPQPEGCARFNFCNFWYVPWNTVCEVPRGREHLAVNTGWNAMMDESYADITMKQSFAAFRQFMTSPEARVQFADSVRFKELSELIPLPTTKVTGIDQVVIDVMTDLRCPISYISLLNLQKALENLNMAAQTVLRFHPVFLNPNVPKEGETLDDYLLREFGYSKEYARSDTYPLRVMGLEAGVNFSSDRRVVNTFDAACLVELAQELGKQHEMVEVLSRSYFEDAMDISQEEVLLDLAEEAGLTRSFVQQALNGASLRDRVAEKYMELNAKIGEVPHFVLRERISGNGVEAGGNRSVESWEAVIQATLEKGRFVGMPIAGLDGREVWMRDANPTSPVSLAFKAQHQWFPQAWPYRKEEFSRMDESDDALMYAEPRFVNHLDESSLARLTEAYRTIFDAAGPGFSVLDLCSSWTSHFPAELPAGARVVAVGLNEKELQANPQASEYHAQDLNKNPNLPYADSAFDFATLALSIQYLTDPLAVFTEMHRVLRPGGMAVVAFSHRCFLEKCVNVWAQETYDGEGHAHLISRYFQHGPKEGWAHLTSFDVSPRHGDPVWLVSAVKAK